VPTAAPSKTISPAVGLDQVHQQPRGGALAAAGFAHHAQRLAGITAKSTPSTARTTPPPLPSTSFFSGKVLDQALDAQQRLGRPAGELILISIAERSRRTAG
jgi:hypothetical protein